ncbi:MAG: hypothetical protein LBE31_08465 [Deltaproteobacteria bacterium]|jgi:hypothetical protein|nr:hypothetical protein [Deltaproteobacteria bacterium]
MTTKSSSQSPSTSSTKVQVIHLSADSRSQNKPCSQACSLEAPHSEPIIIKLEHQPISTRRLNELFIKSLKILTVLAMLAFFGTSSLLAAEPLNLAELTSKGLSERSRDIIVTQALSHRARPPLEIGFVLEMAAYGGDELARTYLEMDADTSQIPNSPLPPESMRNLMASGLDPKEIKDLILSIETTEAPNAALAIPAATTAAATYVTLNDAPPVAPKAPEAPATPPAAATPNPTVGQGDEWLRDDYAQSAALYAPQSPQAPQAPAQPSKADLRHIPQVLAPGQSADPSRPLPVAPGPYWTRTRQTEDGFFMGVTDEIKVDGHRYEVHTNSKGGVMGQEVLSRASGHKVVRHYNGRTESKPEVAAPKAPNSPMVQFYDPNELVRN